MKQNGPEMFGTGTPACYSEIGFVGEQNTKTETTRSGLLWRPTAFRAGLERMRRTHPNVNPRGAAQSGLASNPIHSVIGGQKPNAQSVGYWAPAAACYGTKRERAASAPSPGNGAPNQ